MRIVTFNIFHDTPPLAQRLATAATWLRQLAPDVVLLQEVQPTTTAHDLARQSGFPHVEIGKRRSDADEGLAILSRTPLSDVRVVLLPEAEDPTWDRVLLSATTVIGDQPIYVHTTHLNFARTASAVRMRQVQAILNVIGVGGAHVIGGDFNAEPQSPEIALLRAAGFVDVGPAAPTWASKNPSVPPQAARLNLNPDRKIDYLFVRGVEARPGNIVLDTPINNVWPSDHFAILADVTAPAPKKTAGKNVLRGIGAVAGFVGLSWLALHVAKRAAQGSRAFGTSSKSVPRLDLDDEHWREQDALYSSTVEMLIDAEGYDRDEARDSAELVVRDEFPNDIGWQPRRVRRATAERLWTPPSRKRRRNKGLGATDVKLIKRVAQLISYDVSKQDIREQLIAEGYDDDDIFQAHQAAKVYLRRRELPDSNFGALVDD